MYSHMEIAAKANETRRTMGITTMGVPNIFIAMEGCGYKVFRYPLGLDAILGASAVYGKERVVVTNSSQILSREIFSAAHEMGHHVLHLDDEKRVAISKMTNGVDETRGMEQEANFFAACFLMPEQSMKQYINDVLKCDDGSHIMGMDIARLQSEFRVSYESVINRLNTIRVISSSKRDDLDREKMLITARGLIKATSGDESLFESSEARCMPPEYLQAMISNYEEKLVPVSGVKKIFDFFGVDAELPENEEIDLDIDKIEYTSRRRKVQ